MSEHSETWVVQGADEIVINVAPDHIWGILGHSQLLPQWMPAVQHTNGHHESLGTVRRCDVNLEGQCGHVVERCVAYEKPHRLGWLMIEDSLGVSRCSNTLGSTSR
ncbi:MAG: SRPBCC family protein (plasmid) [Nitrospira sp.]